METRSKKARVSLISFTQNSVPLMCFFHRVMHAPVPDTLEEFVRDEQKWLGMSVAEYFEKALADDGMPSFLECISMTFKLENVSRALTHQLVRHRIGFTYAQQSQRCVRMENFADDGYYHCPSTVTDPLKYDTMMKVVQTVYREALERGCSTQDARGLLPTNIQTTIMFTANLSALIGMVNKRLCIKTQEEFQGVGRQIARLVTEKIDVRFRRFFDMPCVVWKKCIMESENKRQLAEGKLKGEQNTSQLCPVYIPFKEGKLVKK